MAFAAFFQLTSLEYFSCSKLVVTDDLLRLCGGFLDKVSTYLMDLLGINERLSNMRHVEHSL